MIQESQFNEVEYLERCNRNIAACERLLGKSMSEDDSAAIGAMVYRQMQREGKGV